MNLVGRLFGTGLPATGVDTALDPRVFAQDSLRLARSGFGKPGLALHWQDADGSWQLHLDAAAAEALLAANELADHPALIRWRSVTRTQTTRRALGWTSIGLLVLSPLLLLALAWWQVDRLVDFAVRHVPLRVDAQLGEASFAMMKSGLDLQAADSPQSRQVAALVARLADPGEAPWRSHVADDPEPNAFALPGGIIVVNTGLLATVRRPEEVAGVLAHEIEHVVQRHGVKQVVRSAGLQALVSLLAGGVPGADMARELGSLSFSRDAEREADARGLERLVARHVDPNGLPEFFDTLARHQDGKAPPAFLSTHPDSGDRAARLRKKIDELGSRAWTPLPMDQAASRSGLGRPIA